MMAGLRGIIEEMARSLQLAVSRPNRLASWTPAPRRPVANQWADTSRYRADNLPAIRKRKGVGRRLDRLGLKQAFNAWEQNVYPALIASHWGRLSPNLAEWERKQRRGEDAADYRARRISRMMDGIAKALAEMGYERATP